MSYAPVKVCVVTGFLGAGKTTVLQRLVPTLPAGEKVRVLVNDLSSDNIDVHAFQPLVAAAADTGAWQTTALSGGCVCCNLLPDLVEELSTAHADGCGYAFVECTGVADPVPVVATLHALPALQGRVEVDAVVAVVAAAALLAVTSGEDVALASLDAMRGAQLCGANVVLINNWESTDRIDPALLRLWVRRIKEFAENSNPQLRVYCTNAGYIAYTDLIYRHDLFRADGVAAFFLRAYAASGKTVGDFDPNAAAEEEAGEMKKLGLRLFTLEMAGQPCSLVQLRRALATARARQLLKGVWRSKGYLLAVDDEDRVGAEAAVVRQFRWQTVQRRVDYGEVLPPHVPLTARDTGVALTTRIVFIGDFNEAEKTREAAAFFAAATTHGDL